MKENNLEKTSSQNGIIISKGDKTLELIIDGYEFPELPAGSDSYDLNWLNVRISGKEKGHTAIEGIEPCVLTWELERLHDAIDALLKGEIHEVDSDIMFLLTESNIYFTIKRTLFCPYSIAISANGFKVSTGLSYSALVRIRKLLALAKRRFPQR